MFGKLLLAIVGLAAAEEVKDDTKKVFEKNLKKTACYHYSDLEYYDFSALQGEAAYRATGINGRTYEWNLCQTEAFCSAEKEIFAANYVLNNGGNRAECKNMSGSKVTDLKQTIVSGGDDEVDHDLRITYTGGDACILDKERTNEFIVTLRCNHD
jgi:hypothetical protein